MTDYWPIYLFGVACGLLIGMWAGWQIGYSRGFDSAWWIANANSNAEQKKQERRPNGPTLRF
jgi:hypothetical protein